MSHRPYTMLARGGLDIVTPVVAMKPGRALIAKNYEPADDGYARLPGIERYDGRPKPSKVTYHILNFDAGVGNITEGQTVTGLTSGATGKALIDAVVQTGSFGGSNATGYLVLTIVSGTFQDNESLQVGGVTKATANGTAVLRGATTDALDTTYYQDAVATARALIVAPSGSGVVRGVHWYNGSLYCFRDNVGGTAGQLLKATSTGWVVQSLGFMVPYTTGSAAISVGQTVTGATSGASGVVTAVVLRTGNYGASSAVGLLTFASITGTFQNGENLQVGGVTKCVASAASSAITLPAGGRYECINHNFSGQSATKKMYGVNGVGTAFEWNGTVFVPIFTGMTTDTPNHIAAHRNYLFLSFPGGSVQYSALLNPYSWSILSGAGEIAIGDNVTNIVPDTETVMVIMSLERVGVLYGNISSEFEFKTRERQAGAVEWTAQQIGPIHYLDQEGVRSMASSDKFGDFSIGTISRRVKPLMDAKRKAGVTVDCAFVLRSKSQYRLFYSDGSFLIFWFGSGMDRPEIMAGNYGKRVRCICAGEESDGSEAIFFGSDDGFVYQMDAGTSLDGSEIDSYVRLPVTCNSPRQRKRFKKLFAAMATNPNINLKYVVEYGPSETEQGASVANDFTVRGGGGVWDVDNWGSFYWSGGFEGRADQGMEGEGSIAYITMYGKSSTDQPHTLKSLTVNFVPGPLER